MYFLCWNFVGALFFLPYHISCAQSLPGDNLFEPNDNQDAANIEYATLPGLDDDLELQSYEDSASLFLSKEDFGSSIPLSRDGDSAAFPSNDLTSAPLFIEDAPLLAAFNDDSALALNDLPLLSLSGESEMPTSSDLFETGEFDPEIVSDNSCIPGEEQDFSKSKRGAGFCLVPEGAKRSYPPVYANPTRWDWLPENAPKPRPNNQQKNLRADLIHCPSGPQGYRMYLICDSGREEDRTYTSNRGVTLVNLNTNRICTLLFLFHTCVKPADSRIYSWIMRGSTQAVVLSRVLLSHERHTLGNQLPRSKIETITPLRGLASAKKMRRHQVRHRHLFHPSIIVLGCFFATRFISTPIPGSQEKKASNHIRLKIHKELRGFGERIWRLDVCKSAQMVPPQHFGQRSVSERR